METNGYNYLSHDMTGFLLWKREPVYSTDALVWVSSDGETPKETDTRTAERMLRRKAHPCECYDLNLKTSHIVYYLKSQRDE